MSRSYAWFVRGEHHAALCQTSMAAVHRADPHARRIVATDEDLTIPGAEMVRFTAHGPMMVANIEAQLAILWTHRTQVVFLDTDVLLLRPFPVQVDDGLMVTWRDTVGGEISDVPGGVADVMPYNYGVMGVQPGPRSIETFIWMRERVRGMAPNLQSWWGNQIALASLAGPRPEDTPEQIEDRPIPWRVNTGNPMVSVNKIPGHIWNYTPRSVEEDLSSKGAVHFKGHTRSWMQAVAEQLGLPWMKEAA